MRIVDTRFRPGTPDTFRGILSNPLYKSFSETTNFAARPTASLDEEVAMLRGLGVTRAVVTGRDIASTEDVMSTNPGMLESVARYPDFFIGLYGVDPHPLMKSLRALRAEIGNGVRGISVDPAMSRLSAGDPKYYPFYALCCEENLCAAITTGCSVGMPGVTLEQHAPWHIDRVAADFPDLKIIISHGGYPWITETMGVALRHANVYMDFSACLRLPQFMQYVEAANGALMNKILFASAHPFTHIRDTLKLYEEMPLSGEARERIMYANAARLFGVEEV